MNTTGYVLILLSCIGTIAGAVLAVGWLAPIMAAGLIGALFLIVWHARTFA